MREETDYDKLRNSVMANVKDRIDKAAPEGLDDKTARVELIKASVAALPRMPDASWCSAMLKARPALLDAPGSGSVRDRIRHAVVAALVAELGDAVAAYANTAQHEAATGSTGPR